MNFKIIKENIPICILHISINNHEIKIEFSTIKNEYKSSYKVFNFTNYYKKLQIINYNNVIIYIYISI